MNHGKYIFCSLFVEAARLETIGRANVRHKGVLSCRYSTPPRGKDASGPLFARTSPFWTRVHLQNSTSLQNLAEPGKTLRFMAILSETSATCAHTTSCPPEGIPQWGRAAGWDGVIPSSEAVLNAVEPLAISVNRLSRCLCPDAFDADAVLRGRARRRACHNAVRLGIRRHQFLLRRRRLRSYGEGQAWTA